MVVVDAAGDVDKETFQRAIADAEPPEASLPVTDDERVVGKKFAIPPRKTAFVNAGPRKNGTSAPSVRRIRPDRTRFSYRVSYRRRTPCRYSSLRAPYANEAKAMYAAIFCNREFVPSTFIEASRAGAFFRSNVSTPDAYTGDCSSGPR